MIHLIAAVGKRGQLGLHGKLPWHDPADLKWFREMTMGKTLVVGHNTAEGLPHLEGRTVLTMERNKTPEEYIHWANAYGTDLWIIGGAKTYALWMPYVDRFHINRIAYDGPADAWMPPLPF